FLVGGEPVVLLNLSRSGDIRFGLPRFFLRMETRFYDGTHQVHDQPTLHTIVLEPDYPRVSLVWHSALPCHFKVQKLERTIVTTRPIVRPDLVQDPKDLVEVE